MNVNSFYEVMRTRVRTLAKVHNYIEELPEYQTIRTW